MDWQEEADRLIVNGARATENGRLDFPDRLLFCPSYKCKCYDCIFRKLYIYLESNGRLGDEGTLAIRCGGSIEFFNFYFPSLYSNLDNYSEENYKTNILPIILKFYDKKFMEELFLYTMRPKKKS